MMEVAQTMEVSAPAAMCEISSPSSPDLQEGDFGSQWSEVAAMMEVALTIEVSVMKSDEVSAPAEMCDISSPSSRDLEDGLQSPMS